MGRYHIIVRVLSHRGRTMTHITGMTRFVWGRRRRLRSSRKNRSHLVVVSVEHRQRCPAGVGGWWRRMRAGPGPLWLLFVERRVRLQGQLQVQDVVYDMLEDLHFADFLILRNGGHEALESGVAVVHVVLQAEQVLLLHPAPGDVDTLLRQIVQVELAAAGGGVLWVDWSHSLHLQ